MASSPDANVQLFAPQNQVVMSPPTDLGGNRRDKHKSVMIGLGIAEVALGGFVFVLWMASILTAVTSPQSYRYNMTYMSPGIWCGIFLFVSGGLGIRIRKDSSSCMYIANIVMSMISAMAMAVLMVMSAITAVAESRSSDLVTIHTLQAILAFGIMIVCVTHSGYGGDATGCLRKRRQGTVRYYTAPIAPPQQFVQFANGQVMPVQSVYTYPAMPVPVVPSYPYGYSQASTSQIAGVPAMMPMTMQTQNANVAHGAGATQTGIPQPQATKRSSETEAQTQRPYPPSYSSLF